MSDATKSARSLAMSKIWKERKAAKVAQSLAKEVAKPSAREATKTTTKEVADPVAKAAPRPAKPAKAPPATTAKLELNEIEMKWFEMPVCLCGCGGKLVRKNKPEQQKTQFLVGHDARLKSAAAKVIKGELPRTAISEAARALKDRIGFLKKRPELSQAF